VDTATISRSAEGPGRDNSKRRTILAAAQEVFAEQGFEAARMDEVARRARVGKGTLYNYFESKEDLLIQAVIASMEEVQERIARAVDPSEEQPLRKLEDVLRMLVVESLPALTQRFHSLYHQAAALIARDSEARRRLFAANQAFYRDRERDFEGLIEAGARAGQFRSDADAAELSLLLQAVFDGLLRRATFDPERVDPARAFAALLQLLRRGLYEGPEAGAASS
jgi:TetR/AcrR family acrAB operon transcriptional repressor